MSEMRYSQRDGERNEKQKHAHVEEERMRAKNDNRKMTDPKPENGLDVDWDGKSFSMSSLLALRVRA